MALIGIHASHELHSPLELLRLAVRAESAGFKGAMSSDHFHPWIPTQGHSAYSFAWLGAALQATTIPIGTICCPVGRYHPAIIAQAAATLAAMYPGRFWLALGTGQALNEHITGSSWRAKSERQSDVKRASAAIRSLWAGEYVTSEGPPAIDRARLYTRPLSPPLLLGAATTPETAKWVASWADGLLTASADTEQLTSIVYAFNAGGGEGKPKFLQALAGYDDDEDTAWRTALKNWPIAALDKDDLQNLHTPEEFTAATSGVTESEIRDKLRVSSDLRKHRAWIEEYLELGFDAIYVYTVSGKPEVFIDRYAAHVLPHFT
jgi:probable non-F420 flavinoid oxidoreductase